MYRQEINIIEVELLGREQQVSQAPAMLCSLMAGWSGGSDSSVCVAGDWCSYTLGWPTSFVFAPLMPRHLWQERIEAERAMAEASGQAQLQRLQDQALQTRVRFNRAKQQYHFPPPFGYK